jgi:mRNA-degrading endonuclease YafQ of YafQ-DinJ toxin-antitoxin module
MFSLHYTNKFKKDYKVVFSRKYNLLLLEELINNLAGRYRNSFRFVLNLQSHKGSDLFREIGTLNAGL